MLNLLDVSLVWLSLKTPVIMRIDDLNDRGACTQQLSVPLNSSSNRLLVILADGCTGLVWCALPEAKSPLIDMTTRTAKFSGLTMHLLTALSDVSYPPAAS